MFVGFRLFVFFSQNGVLPWKCTSYAGLCSICEYASGLDVEFNLANSFYSKTENLNIQRMIIWEKLTANDNLPLNEISKQNFPLQNEF